MLPTKTKVAENDEFGFAASASDEEKDEVPDMIKKMTPEIVEDDGYGDEED